MLKKSITTYPIQWLVGIVCLITAAALLFRADISLAHLTQQNSAGQPETYSPTASSIASQEVVFTADTFAQSGQLNGLEAGPDGLRLAAGYATGDYTSAAVNSPLPFTTDVVPLWSANEATLETRLSLDGGQSWSDWLANPAAFFPVRDNLTSGNLIWAGSSQTAVQFRVTLHHPSSQFSRLLLVFNDTSQGPSDAEIAGQMARVASTDDDNICPVDKPEVVARSQWGYPGNWRFDHPTQPRYAAVTHVIVHQTETPNNTNPYQDYAGWVRSIWNFHANVLGWGDVGYNYLVDPNGIIYEGRAGGDNVIGIHDTHNAGSMGLGLIGCYGNCDDPRLSVAEPSTAMLDSTAELMAWKLGQQEIEDPFSTGDYDRLQDIPVIAGGRDVTMTSAPGDNVYDQLPNLRAAVAQKNSCLQACQITDILFDQAAYTVGDPIIVTARLADADGAPLAGAHVSALVSYDPQIQDASGFGFEDRAGDYQTVFTDTLLSGLYTFNITANDPTAERFLTCTASATVSVTADNATPLPTEIPQTPTITPTVEPGTPTPTPTPSPTTLPDTPTPTPSPTLPPNTPTATPTPEPTGTLLRIVPQSPIVPVCSTQEAAAVMVENVTGLVAAQLEIAYDPAVVQIIDADPNRDGVQVQAGAAFAGGFVAQNLVDTTNGRILFAATLLSGSNINGNAELVSFDWQPVAAGVSAMTLENIILANGQTQIIEATLLDGSFEVIADCNAVTGVLSLQGRTDHSGITVTNGQGQQTQTDPNGAFAIAQAGPLSFTYPGYLSAQASLPVSIEAANHIATIDTITLLAGDINNDNIINIIDLTYIAQKYSTTDPLADLNADGLVDILDLVLSASNYGQGNEQLAMNNE